MPSESDSEQSQDEDLALLNLDVELLSNVGSAQEVLGRQNAQVAVLVAELLVVLKHLGVHDVRRNIALGRETVLGLKIGLDLDKIGRLEELARALREHGAESTEGLGAQRLGEATERLAHKTLQVVEDRAGEGGGGARNMTFRPGASKAERRQRALGRQRRRPSAAPRTGSGKGEAAPGT